ncbi:MAG: type II toxin-antitoxin system RelE family toxin [Candidatus Binatia bacterium]
MTWQVEFAEEARKELRSLDAQTQREILRYLRDRIAGDEDPRRFGKALTGSKLGLWRYRVGDFWIVCKDRGRSADGLGAKDGSPKGSL